MNKTKFGILGCLALFTAFPALSQIDPANTRQGENVEYCLQHKKLKALKQNPAFLAQFEQEQARLREFEQQLREQDEVNRVVYKIPIVFHVLHYGGEENITNSQILDGLQVLNRDYRLQNEDADDVDLDFHASNPNALATPADIEIEFVLATKAPDGTCFGGITRTYSPESYSGDGQSQLDAIINGNDIYNGEWFGDEYMNIFICGDIGGAAGYTYNPSDWFGNAMGSGIFLLHDYLGRIGTGSESHSRVLTHEVGHWLNLSHTWGSTNNPGLPENCDVDDEVQDTPECIGMTACILNDASCGPHANVENYMEYSYCDKMFTHGQKDRMRAALLSDIGGRNNLSTAANLAATGADGDTYLCNASFYADQIVICAGSTVQFFDNSFNNVTSWNWDFPGAIVQSSNDQNPQVTYDTPGEYTVSLTVSDGNTTLTKTVNQYITVTGAGLELPFLDGFEDYTTLPESNYWEVYNQESNAVFHVTENASHSGAKSVKLSNFGQLGSNVDELISGPIDLSGITSSSDVTLSFRFSYRKRASTNAEKLYVLLTGNCGETWEIRKSLQGSSLGSLVSSTSWTPSTEADWVTVHMTNITSPYWNQNFRYKFRFEGSGGNNLYLDNINIYPSGPSEELVGETQNQLLEQETSGGIILYPNPAENELNISYFVSGNQVTIVRVVDLLGQVISEYAIQAKSGENLVVLSTEKLAAGMYQLQLVTADKTRVQKFQIK